MNIEQFKEKYAKFKDVDKIQITCDHPQHQSKDVITIGKQPARRNILKNNGAGFICRECFMHYNNPMNHVGESRQTNELISVICPHPQHSGEISREMKKTSYYGSMEQPYMQVCGSCAQSGKIISDDQKEAIRIALKGIPKSEEFKLKLAEYWKSHPERLEQAIATLLENRCTTGMLGKEHSDETKQKMSDAHAGKIFTDEHCDNISEGRKKMLEETGGFTREHREAISRAVVLQYKNGFEPKLHHLTGWHESPKAGSIFYRSSYEKKAFLKLDSDDSVKSYTCEKVITEFFNPVKKITSSYMIDLLIEYTDGSKKLVEIKPASWLEDEVVKCKIEAGKLIAEKMGCPFEIWTEMDLFGHVYNKKNMQIFIDKIRKGEV